MEWIWKPLKAAVARNTHSGVFYKGKLYIFGGCGPQSAPGSLCEVDPETGNVRQVEGSIPDRYSHSATVLGDSIYIFGGKDFFKRLNELWEYSFVKRSWSEIRVGSPPSARTSHSVVAHNDCLYVFGGLFTAAGQPDRFYNDLYEFSPALRRWTLLRSTGLQPPPLAYHSAVVLKHRMLVFGGISGVAKSNALWSYSFESREWSLVNVTGPCPEPRFCHTAVVSENAMYVFGGNSEVGSMNDLWSFDGNQEQWRCLRTVGSPPDPSAPEDTMLVHGGIHGKGCLGDLYALRMGP
ncbi:putative Kelch-type beta propeller [Paratrimastix pyriformis]|uniref:Kelch-type beta propeller n=1 Tax=Paratrimastix pyriformis TaxID=342808 RepID=A0ABQ8U449_9EUKA|nr:putative Kelch-type beta propeller [Paratrimastix pyriformis]